MFRLLTAEKVIITINILRKRVKERFPGSSIAKVCSELLVVANECKSRAEKIAKPNIILRFTVGFVVVFSIATLVISLSVMDLTLKSVDAGGLIQLTEASINSLVLIGAAIFFLVTVETRIKRNRALVALHELRTIAHVIDMHQLTKDPARLSEKMTTTSSSPKFTMTAYELIRYLDYCSEMLSLTGKIAALYAQNFRDGVVLSAVNELENLTTGLSRKIWQKIMILHKLDENDNSTKPE